MERRPLDFNAPLLSARRYTSPRNSSELVQFETRPPPSRRTSLPVNKSEWESDGITKPASIPFNWEQTPGRPKPESRIPIPRPPPGRFNSCEIPRLPPGRLSGYQSGEQSNNITTVYTDHALLLQKLNDSLNCKDDSDSSETESEEDDYSHSDALNTLSLTDTCSDSKQKPSGKFCVDKQTADFMMSRFLPAAKAAVLETPKKKMIGEKPKEVRKMITEKPVEVRKSITERPNDVRKVVSGEILTKQLIMKQYGSDVLPTYFKHPDFDNVESDDEDHSIVVPVKKSGRSWGINIPRMCVNLKNPLPAMMSKSRPQTPSRIDDRRFRRNAVSGPLDKVFLSGPLDKSGSQVPPKKKFYSGLISSHGLENNNNNSNRSSNGPSQHLVNSPSRSGLSPLRRYRSGNISPYRNESPKSAFREGAGFLGLPNINSKEDANRIASSRKMFRALQEVSRTNPVNETGLVVEEKMVYVDSISRRTVKPKQEEGKTMGSKYFDELIDVKMNQSLGQESRGMKLELKGGEKLVDSYIGRKSDNLPLKSRDVGLHEKDVKVKREIKGEKLDKSCTVGECDDLPVKSPLPPPLPKSPSESWLWRTLPSIPLGNPFGHSHRNSQIHSKKQGRKEDAKWENIVKTSNGRHDHARYSEEHMPHLSYRQSKS